VGQPAWKPAHAGTSWTIKGVRESTRDAVREAAAEADMLIGDWVDQALERAAREAMAPSPPAASKADVAAVLEQIGELKAAMVALAGSAARAEDLAAVQAEVRRLGEGKVDAKALAAVEARVEKKLAERGGTGYERPAVRHVMVEKKRPARRPIPAPPRMTDQDPRES